MIDVWYKSLCNKITNSIFTGVINILLVEEIVTSE